MGSFCLHHVWGVTVVMRASLSQVIAWSGFGKRGVGEGGGAGIRSR